MMEFKHDMSGMFAIHDALRRDLARVMQSDARSEGWIFFEKMLLIHHEIEDEMLWPLARERASGRPDDLDLLDQMTSEHTAIRPLLERVDQALVNRDASEPARSDLERHVVGHLTHEEQDALPLLDRTLTDEQWSTFDRSSVQRMAPEMHRYVPWLLDGADERRTTQFLTFAPSELRAAFLEEWRPAYEAADPWATPVAVGSR